MNIAEQLQTIADNVPKVYQAGYDDGAAAGGGGGDKHYDAFWDMFQQNGERTDYQYAFAIAWTDKAYNPKYPIVCDGGNLYTATGLFNYSLITDTKVPIIVRDTRADTMFQHCTALKKIPSITFENVARFSNTFRNCTALEEVNIQGEINVAISFADSPLLTDLSILSIIDHLKDLTGATAQTLTFHATVGGKLTQAQKDAISAKNWTLAY